MDPSNRRGRRYHATRTYRDPPHTPQHRLFNTCRSDGEYPYGCGRGCATLNGCKRGRHEHSRKKGGRYQRERTSQRGRRERGRGRSRPRQAPERGNGVGRKGGGPQTRGERGRSEWWRALVTAATACRQQQVGEHHRSDRKILVSVLLPFCCGRSGGNPDYVGKSLAESGYLGGPCRRLIIYPRSVWRASPGGTRTARYKGAKWEQGRYKRRPVTVFWQARVCK